jgi:arginine utilization protein RocB
VNIPTISGVKGQETGEHKIAKAIIERLGKIPGVQARVLPGNLAFGYIKRSDNPSTLLLFGHTDTVGIDDYGKLKELATDPDNLANALINEGTDAKAIEHLRTGNWMCGRGSFDMKAGLAVEIEVLARLAADKQFKGNVIFLGTPDEENNSEGIFGGLRFLPGFLRDEKLVLKGAINADYTAPTSTKDENDANQYLYVGTVGKVLPCFYVVGKATHAGEVFNGLDANLINAELMRLISLSSRLRDKAEGEVTLPPVSLKSGDLRDDYSVQTPLTAWSYFNVFTNQRTPEQVMKLMMSEAKKAKRNIERVFESSRRSYCRAAGLKLPKDKMEIPVYTYQELLDRANGLTVSLTKKEDPRIASRRIIEDLWRQSGLPGPAIILFLSPPYYPHSFISQKMTKEDLFVKTACQVAKRNGLINGKFYPYISDASYLRAPEGNINLGELMPLWGPLWGMGYTLPLEEMRTLGDLPVINLGPWGRDAHKPTERVYMPYSFGRLPDIMEAVIRETFRE